MPGNHPGLCNSGGFWGSFPQCALDLSIISSLLPLASGTLIIEGGPPAVRPATSAVARRGRCPRSFLPCLLEKLVYTRNRSAARKLGFELFQQRDGAIWLI